MVVVETLVQDQEGTLDEELTDMKSDPAFIQVRKQQLKLDMEQQTGSK